MREVSATEVSRNFSAVLDSTERGETILVTRGGVPVATIAPAPRANEVHAELLAHVRRSGTPRGAHHLMIAATARASDRTLVTTDGRARFDELPGVQVRLAEPG